MNVNAAVLFVSACLALTARRCSGASFFVATNGLDGDAGTFAAPWRTIARALQSAGGGDTIYLRGGVYAERVAIVRGGTPAAPLVLRNYPGEPAVLDGSTLVVSNGWDPLVLIRAVTNVTVQGLEIRNWKTAVSNRMPIGVLVTGRADGSRGCTNIHLVNLTIHDIWQTYDNGRNDNDGGSFGSDAHGLAVYGNGGSAASVHRDITVEGCDLRDLKLGTSEALVFNGNVSGFTIRSTRVHDCNNIGVDCIGFEGVSPSNTLDQARFGSIVDCEVYNISTEGNPGYRTGPGVFDHCAAAIYVDGGREIVIERNRMHDSDLGCEIASEHAGKKTERITLRNNLIYRNTGFTGLALGGYASSGTGMAEDCRIVGNTFYGNDSAAGWSGQIHLQYDVRSCRFQNNLIVAHPNTGVFVGDPSAGDTRPVSNAFDYNCYYNPGAEASAWVWRGTEHNTLAAWRTAVGGDAHAFDGQNPLLVNPATGDLHIAATSPARNAGSTASVGVGVWDADGEPRTNGVVDIGADEYQAAPDRSFGIHSVAADATGMELAFPTFPARTCRLCTSSNLKSWASIPGETLPGTGTNRLFRLPRESLGTRRFLRVESGP